MTKHHPASVDLELVKRLVATTKAKTLQAFLSSEFCNISREHAGALPNPCHLQTTPRTHDALMPAIMSICCRAWVCCGASDIAAPLILHRPIPTGMWRMESGQFVAQHG